MLFFTLSRENKLTQLFNLFRQQKCLIIIDNIQELFTPEQLAGKYKPEYKDSRYFSVETDYSDISFGVHKPWKHLSEDQLIEKEMQLKYNQQIEEKILNNILKINILVSIICIFLIIIYFTLDKKIIKLEKKNVIEAEKSKKKFIKIFF